VTRRSSFDHRLLAQRHPVEVARFRVYLARLVTPGQATAVEMMVEHEADGTCCLMEPWPVTLAVVLAEVPLSEEADGPAALPGAYGRQP
jgi:hypothetical protein